MRIFASLLSLLFLAAPVSAQTGPDIFPPDIEKQAREIGRGLRCVVCRSQSIEDSDADLAGDMRLLVRRRLVAGDSPEEVMEYVRDRYGDYVLLRPPVQPNTWALWAGPFLVLIMFFIFLWRR
ncbi:MAG: cytochrome c-type biogenesis protein CcmH, partial [Hyphomonadaceae bacterium]|nr:cytochrome c-type biogenesis protein CcmH [Hyphomonadaceae bacterium]